MDHSKTTYKYMYLSKYHIQKPEFPRLVQSFSSTALVPLTPPTTIAPGR